MNMETIQDIIADIRKKEKAAWRNQSFDERTKTTVENYGGYTIGLLLDSIATRLERVIKDGLYVTPKKAIDAVLANPPLEGFAKFLAAPALGIQFKRHKSEDMTLLVASWKNDHDDHVYEVRVVRDGETPGCGWRATGTNDGRRVFSLAAKNRSNCEKFALSAMKSYLKRGHRKTYRSIRKRVVRD